MRTAIFLGLLFMANAINPQEMDDLSATSVTVVAVLTVLMMTADFFEILKEK